MKFLIEVKYYHPGLKIGLENIKEAWLLTDIKNPVELKTIMYQGNLYYRFPGSGKRVSYKALKKGLIKMKMSFQLPMNILPF